ncbi:hypothetical protein [Prochlorothrix hollandica]|uniref:Uncharacterized protein n=1 Tax=Prochlorothrix hollandica PCC 9006 = CALU 1027 TaxID=317619 RepID=A0A0M2PX96_PROHO|nr:hypothetical protein [Prochlorothrix hollandica]KKI99712.1 hypothetical protein PROH_07470 [Prochlorothrix hollandica PCC 9006 = CALU 1027]
MSISPLEFCTLALGIVAVWAMYKSTTLWVTAIATIVAVICGVLSYDFAPWPLQIAMVGALLMGSFQLPSEL